MAPLPPRGLRGILDETVTALVDCLVTFIFLATATVAVIDVAQEPAGPRVTTVLSDMQASSAPVGAYPTDVSVTPFV